MFHVSVGEGGRGRGFVFQMWSSFLSGGGHPIGGINFDGVVLKKIVGWAGGVF